MVRTGGRAEDPRSSIHAFSKADAVPGQGVGSAYLEQVALITSELSDEFRIVDRARRPGDVNHFHSINPELLARVPRARRRGTTVGHVHFIPETVRGSIQLPGPARRIFDAYLMGFYRSMDHLVTVNPWFITKLAEDYGVDPSRISFIPNFVSERDFHPLLEDPEVEALREELGLDATRPVVLCAGQLQVRKGFFDVLEVARAMPDVQFLWAGGFSFGRITAGHSEIQEASRDLPRNMRLLGMVPRERMNLTMNLADCFFLPSYEELFPMTILEAMATRTPVLVRELVYYEGVLSDFAARIPAERGETAPFVEALAGVLRPGPRREDAIDAAGRGAERYSRSVVAEQWRDFYRSVTPGSMLTGPATAQLSADRPTARGHRSRVAPVAGRGAAH